MSFTVLISSAGRRVSLLHAFRDAFKALGIQGRVFASDMSSLSAAYHSADAAFVVPGCLEPTFLPHMLALCRRESIDMVVPTIDTELPVYAANRAAFGELGTKVVISDPDVIAIAADKSRTHAFLREHGLPTVDQANADELNANRDGWPLPLVVKPRFGSASIGVTVASDWKALEATLSTGEWVVQRHAVGNEYTIDAYVDERGACRCAVPRQRLEVRAGEVSKAITIRVPEIDEVVKQLIDALPSGARGPITVQLFWDSHTRAISVIEINPRFAGGFPLSLAAGADFPRWLIESALGRTSAIDPDGWIEGLMMLRYDEAVFVRNTALFES
jgi:carbamoyl-phosphate synthase large subunit